MKGVWKHVVLFIKGERGVDGPVGPKGEKGDKVWTLIHLS